MLLMLTSSSCGCEYLDVASTCHAVTVSVPAMLTAAGAHSKAGKKSTSSTSFLTNRPEIYDTVYHTTLTYTHNIHCHLSTLLLKFCNFHSLSNPHLFHHHSNITHISQLHAFLRQVIMFHLYESTCQMVKPKAI